MSASVEIKDENKQYLLTNVDMKDSAAAIRAPRRSAWNCLTETSLNKEPTRASPLDPRGRRKDFKV